MSSKRCGTCIGRKIRCDRQVPACSQCLGTDRDCLGYGLRLSWPRQSDRKRHVLGPATTRKHTRTRARDEALHFIHVTNMDIGIYRYLKSTDRGERAALARSLRPALAWAPLKLTIGEKHLLEYFDARASNYLTTLHDKPLAGLLVRIALTSNSLACVAVQRSILALSSLLRYGDSFETQYLKLSAVQALAASAKHGVSSQNAAQHVSAGLLLCMLEIYAHSETSHQWICYVEGARDVVATISTDWFDCHDLSDLSDWVYHHEVLSQFTLAHWKPDLLFDEHAVRPATIKLAERPRCGPEPDPRLVPRTTVQRRNDILLTLSDVITSVIPPGDQSGQSVQYQDRIRSIRNDLSRLVPTDDEGVNPSALLAESASGTSAELIHRLYQLSTLIYLEGALGSRAGGSSKLARYARAGLRLLGSMPECSRPFPILIIGAEAQTEEERKSVLDLIHRTNDLHPDRRLECMKDGLMLALWNQDDLHAAERTQPGYLERLTVILSLCGMIPSFA